MFCRFCGHEVHPSYNVCPSCGHALNDVNKKQDNKSSNFSKSNSTPVRSSRMAIAGFVLGLISYFSYGFLGILGLIFSIIGMNQTKDRKYSKRGFAIAGVVLSSISLAIWIFIFILYFFMFLTSYRVV